MNLVLAHDYLIQMGGAERVVAAMHEKFPSAPILTSAVRYAGLWEEFCDADLRTTWMQRLPFIQDPVHFKKYALLYPFAFRNFGKIAADVAWISSSTFAKYLRFPPETRTVCYLHNTTRFYWQTDDYLNYAPESRRWNPLLRHLLPPLREMDRAAAGRMDVLVANSRNVQERIKRCYHLDSQVIHPPVETARFSLSGSEEGYYLIVSRLLGYKNVQLPVRAFTRTGQRLVVVGDGPYRSQLEQMAGPSVKFCGRLPDSEIQDHYAKCRGMILPGEEDFGITPVEAMACGKPVIALARGGALETVLDGITGVFFSGSSEEAFLDAVTRCENIAWNKDAIRDRALLFSKEAFLEKTMRLLFAQ
ncbi:MAG: glycosyltransferase [Chthoniobacterales bacterium]|mgnify:CR=1 FL=1|nr:glycosyltransferase [Chthoniobacterales bacterium]